MGVYVPIYAMIVLFVRTVLDVLVGHFARLELATHSKISVPVAKDMAICASLCDGSQQGNDSLSWDEASAASAQSGGSTSDFLPGSGTLGTAGLYNNVRFSKFRNLLARITKLTAYCGLAFRFAI